MNKQEIFQSTFKLISIMRQVLYLRRQVMIWLLALSKEPPYRLNWRLAGARAGLDILKTRKISFP
jgi:hypothetical protein